MDARSSRFTRWSVLGAGEAGCRVASHYFATHPNPAVENRVMLLNTAQGDFTNLYRTLDAKAKDRLDIAMNQSHLVGASGGAGNWFVNGETSLEKDWQGVSRFISSVVGGQGADVTVHCFGMGGGTGNGCIPKVIQRLKRGDVKDVPPDIYQFGVGIWPHDDDGEQRKFNAVMGLSRLLMAGSFRTPNADLALLLGNQELARLAVARKVGSGKDFQHLNRMLVEVLNALISPGQESMSVIDARDYAVNAQRYRMPHFTAGVAWDMPTLFKLEEAFEEATNNVLLPIDPLTSISAHIIVQVPPEEVHGDGFTPTEVTSAFRAWSKDSGLQVNTQMESVVPNPTLHSTYHAVIFFGGFDLTPLLQPLAPLVQRQIDIHSPSFGHDEDEHDRLKDLWQQLLKYVEVSNERRKVLRA